ncbi:Putative lipid-transfer protein DIR1 [Linum perenne]
MGNIKALPVLCMMMLMLVLAFPATIMGNDIIGEDSVGKNCNVDPSRLIVCRSAVTGKHPPPPTTECCRLMRRANLPCLCKFKSFLPAFGIDPSSAMSLPKKCGLNPPPPQCY